MDKKTFAALERVIKIVAAEYNSGLLDPASFEDIQAVIGWIDNKRNFPEGSIEG